MEKLIGRKVIVRGDRSGVFFGTLVRRMTKQWQKMKNIEKYFESEDEE